MEGGGPVAMEPIEVSGKLFHFNKGAAFFSFRRDGIQGEQICLFRPNKIIIDKQKLGASNFKSVDAIAKVSSDLMPCDKQIPSSILNLYSI